MTRPTTDPSASYAAEVARLLWPAPWAAPYVTRSRHHAGQHHRDAYLFPSERRPRLLLPADLPASSSMLLRLGDGRSAVLGPVRALLERSVRSRVFPLTRWPMLRVPTTDPGADSIERHLSGCFGTEVRVGVLLGTRRANQKPVLQVFDLDGGLRGFAKIGHNALTAALVRREAAALATVAAHAPRAFRAPRVLHHAEWSGLQVLVISPLTVDPGTEVPRRLRLDAMREVTRLTGTATRPLATSDFWVRLRDTAAVLPEGSDGDRVRSATAVVEQAHGGDPVRLGGWHGDWGHWNEGMGDAVLNVWDWERHDTQVPLGFDGLHFAAQRVRPGERDARRQEQTFLRSVPGTLAELGVRPAEHDLTLRLYLLEIAVRYVGALVHGPTPALRRRTSWVLSLLEQLIEHSPTTSSEGRP